MGEEDVNITFAISTKGKDAFIKHYGQPPNHEVIATRKLSAFGHIFRLITGT